MNTNDLNTALYEKMAAEQDKYRDWLKSQPPEEILHHTYEYTVREDIVMAMEDLELTDAQAQALLDSPTPLADVYRHFEKLETGYMDVIRDSIENRADDVCKVLEEQRSIPLYLHSAAYASQHGEMAQYNRSYQANFDCKEAIEHAISAHYADNRLDTESAVKAVLEKFGSERVQFRCGDGSDPAENGTVRNKKPERLSAEDGCGRLCGTAGLAGAEGTGIPVAPKQQ